MENQLDSIQEDEEIFKREKTITPKKEIESNSGYVRTNQEESKAVQKITQNIKNRYKKAIATQDIANFHQQALSLVLDHLKQGEFGGHKAFMREIEYFVHYLFLMLQDDFFFGKKLFKERMTKLDDYIFSQYRREPALEENIQKITVLSYSNRFDKDPRSNLLSYFVFIEESGIELIVLLQDFYKMLDKTQGKKSRFFNIAFNNKDKKIHKTYVKVEDSKSEDLESLSSKNTFYTVQPSFFEKSKDAQVKVYRDVLTPINESLKKNS